jgi:hypothetical protein
MAVRLSNPLLWAIFFKSSSLARIFHKKGQTSSKSLIE